MKVVVVLPAFNESPNIQPLLKQLEALRWPADAGVSSVEAILVDDGSTDDTAAQAQSLNGPLPVRVIQHYKNYGLGATLRTGLQKAVDACGPGDVIVTLDSDQTHPPEVMKSMIAEIKKGADVVIASRYAPGGKEIGLTVKRKVLSAACSRTLGMLFGVPGVSDYSCGYRMFRSEALQALCDQTENQFFEENGFVCMAELLLTLHRNGARFAEVPLVLRYDLKGGLSKMKVWPTVGRYVRLVARLKLGKA